MKAYAILMVFGMLGISTVALSLALEVIDKQQELIEELTKEVNPYADCEGDMDYYLKSVELKDNKYLNVPDSVALLAAKHPHVVIAATIEYAGGELHVELD